MFPIERGWLRRIELAIHRILRVVEPEAEVERARWRYLGGAVGVLIGVKAKNLVEQNSLNHRPGVSERIGLQIGLIPRQPEAPLEGRVRFAVGAKRCALDREQGEREIGFKTRDIQHQAVVKFAALDVHGCLHVLAVRGKTRQDDRVRRQDKFRVLGLGYSACLGLADPAWATPATAHNAVAAIRNGFIEFLLCFSVW
jgi:hypothetical protein